MQILTFFWKGGLFTLHYAMLKKISCFQTIKFIFLKFVIIFGAFVVNWCRNLYIEKGLETKFIVIWIGYLYKNIYIFLITMLLINCHTIWKYKIGPSNKKSATPYNFPQPRIITLRGTIIDYFNTKLSVLKVCKLLSCDYDFSKD